MINKRSGFTLIETLIYAVLVTVVITFSILSVYQLIDSQSRNKHRKELVENQRLLEQKIYWTLQNNSVINSPSSGATTTSLSVNKIGFASNPVIIDVDGGVARLKLGSAAAQPITNGAYTEVQNFSFHQFDLSGQSAIRASGNLFDSFTSTTVALDTTIIVK